VPTPEWKRQYFANTGHSLDQIWKPGDSINLSVGQGNLQVTPLQLAVAYAAIATGKVPTPTVTRRVADPLGESLQIISGVRPPRPVDATDRSLVPIREGLRLAANEHEGTSASVFSGVPEEFRVAGKTGTAEHAGGEDHALFVGYAPLDRPELVVAIVIEQAGTGAEAAAPAVCETMAAAFHFDPGLCGGAPPA
jgi:penicillin-binding protein 2